MIEAVLKALEAGLTLWNTKEGTKYLDRILNLKKDYHNEMSKPLNKRSDADLDNIIIELRFIADTFSSSVGKSSKS